MISMAIGHNSMGCGSRLTSAKKLLLQPLHLFVATEPHQFIGHRSLLTTQGRPKVAGKNHQPADEERRLGHLIKPAENLPNRRATQSVVELADVQLHLERAV